MLGTCLRLIRKLHVGIALPCQHKQPKYLAMQALTTQRTVSTQHPQITLQKIVQEERTQQGKKCWEHA